MVNDKMVNEPIYIADYNYPLPDERIAKYPLKERDHSKLLVYEIGVVSEDLFFNVGDYITPHSLLIYNNTRVIQARLEFHKKPSPNNVLRMSTGHSIELSSSPMEGRECSKIVQVSPKSICVLCSAPSRASARTGMILCNEIPFTFHLSPFIFHFSPYHTSCGCVLSVRG